MDISRRFWLMMFWGSVGWVVLLIILLGAHLSHAATGMSWRDFEDQMRVWQNGEPSGCRMWAEDKGGGVYRAWERCTSRGTDGVKSNATTYPYPTVYTIPPTVGSYSCPNHNYVTANCDGTRNSSAHNLGIGQAFYGGSGSTPGFVWDSNNSFCAPNNTVTPTAGSASVTGYSCLGTPSSGSTGSAGPSSMAINGTCSTGTSTSGVNCTAMDKAFGDYTITSSCQTGIFGVPGQTLKFHQCQCVPAGWGNPQLVTSWNGLPFPPNTCQFERVVGDPALAGGVGSGAVGTFGNQQGQTGGGSTAFGTGTDAPTVPTTGGTCKTGDVGCVTDPGSGPPVVPPGGNGGGNNNTGSTTPVSGGGVGGAVITQGQGAGGANIVVGTGTGGAVTVIGSGTGGAISVTGSGTGGAVKTEGTAGSSGTAAKTDIQEEAQDAGGAAAVPGDPTFAPFGEGDKPTVDNWPQAIKDFIANNPIANALGTIGQVETSSAVCKLTTGTIWGHTIDFDFCRSEIQTMLSLLGTMVFMIAGIYSIWIIAGQG